MARYILKNNGKVVRNPAGLLGNNNISYGLNFDKVNDYVYMGTSFDAILGTIFQVNNQFTVSFIVNLNSSFGQGLGQGNFFWANNNAAYDTTTKGFNILDSGGIGGGVGNIQFLFANLTGGITAYYGLGISQGLHRITFVYRGINDFNIYVDDVVATTAIFNTVDIGIIDYTGVNGLIGYYPASFLQGGTIYDFKLFNIDLTGVEVKQLSDYNRIPITVSTNIVLDLPFSSLYKVGADWFTPDKSGNNYNGRLFGYPNGSQPLRDLAGNTVTQS